MKPLHMFYAILISGIWGANFLITKVGLQELPPIFFTCLRYTAIVCPLIFLVSRGGLAWDLILKIGTTLGTLTFTLAFIGIKLGVPAGLTSLLMQTQVVFTLVLSALVLRDVPSAGQQIGVTVSAAGVGLLVWNHSHSPTLTGLMFVLAGALCSGITKIIMKREGQFDAFRLMIWMSLVPPVPLFLLSMIFETGQLEALRNVSYRGVGAVLFNAFVSTVLGFGLMGHLIKIYSPNMVAPYAFLVPVFGLAGGYFFLDEVLDATTTLAVVVIMFGLLYPGYVAPRLSKSATG